MAGKSDERCWNSKGEQAKQEFNERKSHRADNSSREFGVNFGSEEIEIDLNIDDSQMIYQHLAALCKDLKRPKRKDWYLNRKSQVYSCHAVGKIGKRTCCKCKNEIGENKSDPTPFRANFYATQSRKESYKCDGKHFTNKRRSRSLYCTKDSSQLLRGAGDKCDATPRNQSFCYDKNSTSSNVKQRILPNVPPTRLSIKLYKSTPQEEKSTLEPRNKKYAHCEPSDTSAPYDNHSSPDQWLINKEWKRKRKRDLKKLRKKCNKQGKEIIKEFKVNEKIRRELEKKKYKDSKKAFKEEIKERKKFAKSTLKRQKAEMKQINKNEEAKLIKLKDKIKKSCKGLKYRID